MPDFSIKLGASGGKPAHWQPITTDANPLPGTDFRLKLPDKTWASLVQPHAIGSSPLMLKTYDGWEIVAWMGRTEPLNYGVSSVLTEQRIDEGYINRDLSVWFQWFSDDLSNFPIVYSPVDGRVITQTSLYGLTTPAQQPEGWLLARTYTKWQHAQELANVGFVLQRKAHSTAVVDPSILAGPGRKLLVSVEFYLDVVHLGNDDRLPEDFYRLYYHDTLPTDTQGNPVPPDSSDVSSGEMIHALTAQVLPSDPVTQIATGTQAVVRPVGRLIGNYAFTRTTFTPFALRLQNAYEPNTRPFAPHDHYNPLTAEERNIGLVYGTDVAAKIILAII